MEEMSGNFTLSNTNLNAVIKSLDKMIDLFKNDKELAKIFKDTRKDILDQLAVINDFEEIQIVRMKRSKK